MTRKNYTKDGSGKAIAEEKMPTDIVPVDHNRMVAHYTDADVDTSDEHLTSDDFAIPRLAILEGLSPQLKPRHSDFIAGARIGQICDTVFHEVWDELLIVPCEFQNIYIKWAPRDSGEGMLAYYGTDPTEYNRLPENDKMKHIDPDGNEIVKHATIFCLNLSAGGRPSTFPMSATRRNAAKQFNTMRIEDTVVRDANGTPVIDPNTGKPKKLFLCTRIYKIKVGQRQKGTNEWNVPIFERFAETKVFDPTGGLYKRGVEFTKQVRAGLVKADFAREEEETSREHAAM